MSYQKVILIGNVGNDPEIRDINNGTNLAKFSVATNKSWKDKTGEWQEATQWHRVEAWRDLAEKVINKVQKGTELLIEGEIIYGSYEKDGQKVYTTSINPSLIRVLAKGKDSQTDQVISEPIRTAQDKDDAGDDLPF